MPALTVAEIHRPDKAGAIDVLCEALYDPKAFLTFTMCPTTLQAGVRAPLDRSVELLSSNGDTWAE